jgi:hypothetical protein
MAFYRESRDERTLKSKNRRANWPHGLAFGLRLQAFGVEDRGFVAVNL